MKNKQYKKCKECQNEFKAFKTTENFCSYDCFNKSRSLNTNKKRNQKPIKSRSNKRTNEEKLYKIKRLRFLSQPENFRCPVFKNLRATEIHHKKGRIGDLLLDDRFWLAVSSKGHRKIEMNPHWAKSQGFSISRLNK